ncbi:MAG: PilZ domain-containing protein [Candidatus Acidiferrum sp.]
MTDPRLSDRRRTRRVRMKQPLRVRPSNAKDGTFEETGMTTNVSQDGLYFVTKREEYREGMRLFVTMPYHGPDNAQNYEYLAQIARVDDLGGNGKGIAVRFLSSTKMKG